MTRPRLGDLAIGLAGGALGAVGSAPFPGGGSTVVTGAALGATLGLARWAPDAAWIAAVCVFLASAALGELPGGEAISIYVGAALVALAAGRYAGTRSGIVAVVALVASSITAAVAADTAWAIFVFIPPAAWGAGRALRERAVVAAQLAERARELETEREAYATLSVRYERARIASELHDIVAHAISVMVVQATAGQRLVDRDPEATSEVFGNIAGAARQAEREMGLLVELLADEAGPSPDLSLVEELVGRAAGSGLDVRLTLEGVRDGFPAGVTAAAYRVVQEGLTNALRYAAGAHVDVRVVGTPGLLTVEVANGPPGDVTPLHGVGLGSGLRGLQERAEALGGSLEAGPGSAGGWRVLARLPAAAAQIGAAVA